MGPLYLDDRKFAAGSWASRLGQGIKSLRDNPLAGVWFRRGRLLTVSPDSPGIACPLSGRNSTYRLVQISGNSSHLILRTVFDLDEMARSRFGVRRFGASNGFALMW
jgi:hypothetical protein